MIAIPKETDAQIFQRAQKRIFGKLVAAIGFQILQFAFELIYIEWLRCKKVQVNRDAMAQVQCDCRAAAKIEPRTDSFLG